MTNILISITIIVLIIITNIYITRTKKNILKQTLYNKIHKIKIFLYILSLIIFIILLIINLIPLGNTPSTKEIIKSIMKSLPISLLLLPLSLDTLYQKFFTDEEKYSHVKTIVTKIYNEDIIKKLNDADINVILLSEEKTKLNKIKEDKITSNILKETIQINTSNLKLIDKKINKENSIKEFKNIKNLYSKIETSRSIHDNYIRTVKYLTYTYLPLIISYIILTILSFPIEYNLLLISLLKAYTTIKTAYLYKHLPYDLDIMSRKVKPSNIIIGNQEMIFLLMESFVISFAITTPYMYVLANGGSINVANTLLIEIFIIINTFLPYYQINDYSFIKNIFKYLNIIKIHIFTLISIIIIIIFNYTKYFSTTNIKIQNNIACLIFSVIIILLLEITKLARFQTKRGSKKNEIKNNKKSRRSKSNNS